MYDKNYLLLLLIVCCFVYHLNLLNWKQGLSIQYVGKKFEVWNWTFLYQI